MIFDGRRFVVFFFQLALTLKSFFLSLLRVLFHFIVSGVGAKMALKFFFCASKENKKVVLLFLL
jgi:hypothetical protein